MKNEYTKGEWEIKEIWNTSTGKINYYIEVDKCDTICDLYFSQGIYPDKKFTPHPNSKANANRIVTCVNMHDELISAIKLSLIVVKKEETNSPLYKNIIYELEKTLNKAKAGSE